MKFALFFLISFGAFAQSAKIGQIHKTVSSAGTPERVSSTDLWVRKAFIQYSASNTGSIGYVGTSVTGAVAARGIAISKPSATVAAQPLELGDMSNSASPKVNLYDVWVDVATNNDEINVLYIE